MKKFTTIALITTILFYGCGEQSNTKIEKNRLKNRVVSTNIQKLPIPISNADITIYTIDSNGKKVLFTQKSSSGFTLNEIGNFDAHLDELEENRFYIFEAKGGENWDIDKDNIIDENPTPNKLTLTKINRGKITHRNWMIKSPINKVAPSE